jgi:hypothetical protein
MRESLSMDSEGWLCFMRNVNGADVNKWQAAAERVESAVHSSPTTRSAYRYSDERHSVYHAINEQEANTHAIDTVTLLLSR